MAGFLIAVLSGALMSIQGVWNTKVTEKTGMYVSGIWVQFLALLTCLTVWLIKGRDSFGNLFSVEPKYMLLGGVLGAGITWTVILSIGKLGPAKAELFIVVAQLAVAYMISLFGWFGTQPETFSFRKFLGFAVAIVGTVIFQWK